jgi:hypothetical protein
MEGVQLVLRKHGLQQRRLHFQAPRCEQGDAIHGNAVRLVKGRRRQLGGLRFVNVTVFRLGFVNLSVVSRRVLVTRHTSPPPLGSNPLNLRTVFLYSS